MADVVQCRLERMVDELEDLEKKGLFTHREIAEIVRQRRKFEYRLKRRSPLKQDFLAYIEFEKKLDSLRMMRRKMTAVEQKKEEVKKMKRSVSDFACVSRILDIYRQAVMRFKGDIGLWFQYLEFCRERKNGRMKKVLAQVIRFHPKVPGVWIYAAAWEFDQNLNVVAARALMQSGLRACPTSEDLWVEYFRMELTYINKLKARKIALGEVDEEHNQNNVNDDEKQWREENNGLFMSIDCGQHDIVSDETEKTNEVADLLHEQGLRVLSTVYSYALEAIPSNLSARKRFLEIVEAMSTADSQEIKSNILSDMKKDFATDPEFWDWLAKHEVSGFITKQGSGVAIMPNQLHKSIEVYEEALQKVPSSLMFSLYINFLKDAFSLGRCDVGASDVESNQFSHLLMIFERASKQGCLTENLACDQVSLYVEFGRFSEAKKLADELCTGKFSDAVNLWHLRLSIEMMHAAEKSPSIKKPDMSIIFQMLRPALSKILVVKAENLWKMAFNLFANGRKFIRQLIDISLVSLARDGGSDNGFSLSSTVINFILQRDGIERAREIYKRFIALPRPGLDVYKTCIDLERNFAVIGEKYGLHNARKLFESALGTYTQDVSLWKDYYALEVKMGTSESTNGVYWRARNIVRDDALMPSSDL